MNGFKFFKQCFLLLVLFSLTLSSCSKDDDENASGDGGGEMTANISGVGSFKSFPASSNAVKQTIASTSTMLVVQGTNSDGHGITMTIMGYTGEGTYDFTFGPVNSSSAIYTKTDVNNPMDTQSWSSQYMTGSTGTITISEETEQGVEGTFSFKGKNGNDDTIKTISEGKFNVNFFSN